jgi:hypothetical protein
MLALEDGNNRLNEGDIEGARTHYQKSVDIKPTASACFNLGVSQVWAHRSWSKLNRFPLEWPGSRVSPPEHASGYSSMETSFRVPA